MYTHTTAQHAMTSRNETQTWGKNKQLCQEDCKTPKAPKDVAGLLNKSQSHSIEKGLSTVTKLRLKFNFETPTHGSKTFAAKSCRVLSMRLAIKAGQIIKLLSEVLHHSITLHCTCAVSFNPLTSTRGLSPAGVV